MRIQNKLITIFFFTSVVLVVAQVLAMQWSIGKGMIDYVNERELKALSGIASSLLKCTKKMGLGNKSVANTGASEILSIRG